MSTGAGIGNLVDELHRGLSDKVEQLADRGGSGEVPPRKVITKWMDRMLEKHPAILTSGQRAEIRTTLLNLIYGYGPLESLLQDSGVSEIMVNDHRTVYIEREGRIERTGVRFRDEDHLRHVIDRIVAPLGRRVDESSPLVDARLPDGSRVNAIIPPLALHGPALTIRKFSKEPFTLDRLVQLGTISAELQEFLHTSIKDRVSLVVSGGTGSGKTSTLNALGLCIPEHERLITIEDAAELQLHHPHWVALESRPANIEGRGEIPIRTLVRNALRMRPDRIIVGEVRGGEAFDMLQAMNTGHRGSLTTLHANSPRDALIRLESMVLMAGFDMPMTAIRRMISGAVELVLQQDRLADGRRVVTSVEALEGAASEDLHLTRLFQYDAGQNQHVRRDPKGSTAG